jgi:hypothetical protein
VLSTLDINRVGILKMLEVAALGTEEELVSR